ncbi:MAG: 2-amino-4-hydroxy-6-hydroxymethyldihydropteridine diphosphokinase [Candidatus Delongbacteria bacterium]|nr:2-amino-4-hydroxy-6-hydroxymethyldihydropteridine diphosphokinase [Candidatus Delongbacteria bacterium]
MNGKILLSIGSNMGDSRKNIENAVRALKEKAFLTEKVSSIYVTEPVHFKDQDDFLNIAVSGRFDGEPGELLSVISSIEDSMERVRVLKYGPRTIDIDIILAGDMMIRSTDLTVPHPEYKSRKFVLVPACEIEPELKDPLTGKTIVTVLSECKDRSEVRIAGKME